MQSEGRCGALAQPDGSVLFRTWAPRAHQVELILLDGEARRSFPMTAEEYGYFQHTAATVPEGQRYAFRLDGGPERPDPASRWQPDGVHAPSAVLRPERFSWSAFGWTGLPREDLVLYELHVGTFTPEGTFDAVVPRLESLRQLSVTAIEIMPVAQFPGTRDWGYDGVYLFAAQNSYGGPHGLQRLVDACHAHGLAVFLDVVYNHFGPEGCYLREFGPYFSDRYHTPWGQAVNYDAAGCDPVRAFILDNVRYWIDTYRFDGLRLDAVHAIYDNSPHPILRAIKETAVEAAGRGRRVEVIAESDLNDVRLLLPPERGGCGLDAQWSDDFHHGVHVLLTGERQGYYEDFGSIGDFPRLLEETFVHAGTFSRHRNRRHGASAAGLPGDRFVIAIQNHDQVGNRARGDRLSTLVDLPRQRLAASLLLLAPHLPLLFMGEEYGETNPFPFFCSFSDAELIEAVRKGRRQEFAAFAWQGEVPDPQAEATFASARLTWAWPEGSAQAGLRRLYHDLLQARRQWPALRDYQRRAARLFPDPERGPLLELIRGGRYPEAGKTLQIFFNLGDQPQPWPGIVARGSVVLFRSESARYGSAGPEEDRHLLPYECVVFGPGSWARATG